MRRIAPLVVAVAALALLAPQPAGAIVGGDEAGAGDWPWQVALVQDGFVICGGVLVALDVVVTAAHCTEGADAGDFQVQAGSVDAGGAGGERRGVARLEQHEGYDSVATRNDISLLVLATPFERSEHISTVALPTSATSRALLVDGAPVVVTGFGSTSEEGTTSPVLREAEIDVLDDATCEQRYARDGDEVFGESQVCAGLDRGHVDACYGDSGGPLVAPADDDRSSWFLVGLVSWGAGCGRPMRPTVYTEVAAFTDWIAEHDGLAPAGFRFDSDVALRVPAVGATRGKSSRYPATIEVDGFDADLTGVAVELRGLSHERPTDLDVWLQAPDGTVVTLLSDVGGNEPVEDVDIVIDAGGADAGGGALPLRVAPSDREPDRQRKGSAPETSLDSLVGIDPAGEWRLLVADDRTGATGTLDGWTLILR